MAFGAAWRQVNDPLELGPSSCEITALQCSHTSSINGLDLCSTYLLRAVYVLTADPKQECGKAKQQRG